jgi:hypothetical protein
LGLKLIKIHRGVKFLERDWMKEYIQLNTDLRTRGTTDFEKDFFKLMNNSVFGKTMENLRNRVDNRIVNDEKKWNKLAKKHNFKSVTIFSENLVAVHMKRTSVKLVKPIYLGMSILDISKTLMYDFHYNYIKPMYGNDAKLLFTDTTVQTQTPYAMKLTPRTSSTTFPTMFTKNSIPATSVKTTPPESQPE